jgi:peptidyl-prolyl cis-trans isomerase D
MLSLMRKHAGSWMIKVLLFAIVVVFSFWGVGSFRSRRDTRLAEVNGEQISYDQYRKDYNNLMDRYRQMYGGQLTDDMLKILRPREQALDQLINHVLMLQEAERLHIRVSKQEVTDAIRQYPAFQSNGVFNYTRYNQLLSQLQMTPGDFENNQQQGLRLQKLLALVQDGVIVPEADAREWYDWNNAEVNLSYILFAPERYQDISPKDEDVQTYFKSHQNDYLTKLQVKVRYMFFDPQRYRSGINVSEDQIAQYYDEHTDEFRTEKTVEARHILFKLSADADAQTVADQKKKALEVYKKAKAGADFAKLAKQYSEGPSRNNGGYLGTFKRESMVKPFADKAFSMQANEISEPVRTQFGWHIIKVEKVNEARTKTLDEVRDVIRNTLVVEKARAKAQEAAETVFDNVFDGDDLSGAGQKYGVPVVTTDFFPRSKPPVEGIGNPRQFAETAFSLEKMAISDIEDYGNGFYLLQVVDKKEPSVPAFESVAQTVKQDLIKERQDKRAKSDAEAMLAQLGKGEPLDRSAQTFKVQVEDTGFFKRTGSIPTIGNEPEIVNRAFQLTSEKPLCEQAIHGQKGWYVIKLKERKAPAAEGFEKEKKEIIERLTQQKRQDVYQQWLADLKSHSTIDINHKMLE